MHRNLAAIVVTVVLAASTSVVLAGSFGVSPVGLSLPANRNASSVTIENTGDSPIVIQGQALAWTQEGGKNLRTESRDLILNPPLFQLAPRERQLVRIASRKGPPRETEAAFRVVFTEILPAQGPQQGGPSLRITLAQDIPVYIEPVLQASKPDVRWEAQRSADGIRLTVVNQGQRHYRLTDVRLNVGEAQAVQQVGTVVALAQSSFTIDVAASGAARAATTMHLQGRLDSPEARDADLPIAIDIPVPAAP